jgi:hypothetical protein
MWWIFDGKTVEYIFMIVRLKVPRGREVFVTIRRRFHQEKKINPKNNAMAVAAAMGIEIINEEEYRQLQRLGKFDTKTSGRINTPAEIKTGWCSFLRPAIRPYFCIS